MTGVLDRLSALDSCAVSDALDTLGLPGATTGVRPLWPSPAPLVGVARTVQAGPAKPDIPAAHIAAGAIEASATQDVVVIANGGRTDVSCWGGILAVAATERGIRGVVIDGACRDIAESEDLGFPVYGRAAVPVSARRRIVQLSTGEPVEFAGVTVATGDIVIADRNGVVFLAADTAERVIALAERIVAREREMATAVRSGRSVVTVMHDSAFPSAEAVS
jgi:regulator of RNase E activity RraA